MNESYKFNKKKFKLFNENVSITPTYYAKKSQDIRIRFFIFRFDLSTKTDTEAVSCHKEARVNKILLLCPAVSLYRFERHVHIVSVTPGTTIFNRFLH